MVKSDFGERRDALLTPSSHVPTNTYMHAEHTGPGSYVGSIHSPAELKGAGVAR